MNAKVWVFFYGSYINLDVLAEVDLVPVGVEVVTLDGFDFVIAPRANIIPSSDGIVYGILGQATHAELDRLYSEHSQGKLGQTYLPEAVIVKDAGGNLKPALTYICHDMTPGTVDEDYVERIAKPAEKLNFPAEYIKNIRSFRP